MRIQIRASDAPDGEHLEVDLATVSLLQVAGLDLSPAGGGGFSTASVALDAAFATVNLGSAPDFFIEYAENTLMVPHGESSEFLKGVLHFLKELTDYMSTYQGSIEIN